jgi:hypothetical protein
MLSKFVVKTVLYVPVLVARAFYFVRETHSLSLTATYIDYLITVFIKIVIVEHEIYMSFAIL